MRTAVDLSLECATQTATLSLSGVIDRADAVAAARLCLALPASVSVLRLDARQVSTMPKYAASALHSIVRDWRRNREGHVEILIDPRSIDALTSRTTDADDASASTGVAPRERATGTAGADPNAALTGVFL